MLFLLKNKLKIFIGKTCLFFVFGKIKKKEHLFGNNNNNYYYYICNIRYLTLDVRDSLKEKKKKRNIKI